MVWLSPIWNSLSLEFMKNPPKLLKEVLSKKSQNIFIWFQNFYRWLEWQTIREKIMQLWKHLLLILSLRLKLDLWKHKNSFIKFRLLIIAKPGMTLAWLLLNNQQWSKDFSLILFMWQWKRHKLLKMESSVLENLSIVQPDLTIGSYFVLTPQNIKKLKTLLLVSIEHPDNWGSFWIIPSWMLLHIKKVIKILDLKETSGLKA